jgi:hypothetical protein
MSYSFWGVATAIGMTASNLLLTFGVIRRLRLHSEMLVALGSIKPPDNVMGFGEPPGGFTATTTKGEQISSQTLTEGHLIAFLSPTCRPCEDAALRFAERAATGARAQALAIVIGGPEEVGGYVEMLEPLAQVVVESDVTTGAVSRAFKVRGFPATCVLGSDGLIVESGLDHSPSAKSTAAS